MKMSTCKKRGSEKLIEAWNKRLITEESMREITEAFDDSKTNVESANVGVQLVLSYSGDDTPRCGNDIAFWLRWHMKYGGVVVPPKIIINGIPFPDLVKMEIAFGHHAIDHQIDDRLTNTQFSAD
jgi:hypothetical protein